MRCYHIPVKLFSETDRHKSDVILVANFKTSCINDAAINRNFASRMDPFFYYLTLCHETTRLEHILLMNKNLLRHTN